MSRYPIVKIASGPVIIEKGRVLLNRDPGDPFWKFPGGLLEYWDFKNKHEALEETAKREVKEEMGIQIKIIKPLKPMLVKNGKTWYVLIHYKASRIGKIKPGGDTIDWGWFDIKRLPKNLAPNIKPVLQSMK
jgi:ADP-ribose pyrophosphatase YjhB (NUDIX family)